MKLLNVALVGRPNVGKSTLFNKLVGSKIAIINDTPGVTRDRIYARCTFGDYNFNVIDTGGIESGSEEFNNDIKLQALVAINEADVVIFVVDAKDGVTPNDLLVRDILRKSGKNVVVAINKVDNNIAKENIYDFYELGFEKYVNTSAAHNSGISELITKVFEGYKPSLDTYPEDVLKFCVIGRPNVGKSSLVNAVLNEERSIVSDIPGTTRDSIDTEFTYEKEKFVIIDTAGMRKKGKIYDEIEKYSLLRSLKAIDRSDVCLLVIDAKEGIIEHDKHIVSYALKSNKALVIVVNKWDQIENKDKEIREFKEKVRNEFQFLPYVPVVFLSAKTKKRIHTLMPEVIKVFKNTNKTLKTSLLNDVIIDAYQRKAAPSYKGKRLKIYYVTQTGVKPPKITFYVNNKTLVHFSYERYLENTIRQNFDLEGTPIIMQFKNKNE